MGQVTESEFKPAYWRNLSNTGDLVGPASKLHRVAWIPATRIERGKEGRLHSIPTGKQTWVAACGICEAGFGERGCLSRSEVRIVFATAEELGALTPCKLCYPDPPKPKDPDQVVLRF